MRNDTLAIHFFIEYFLILYFKSTTASAGIKPDCLLSTTFVCHAFPYQF